MDLNLIISNINYLKIIEYIIATTMSSYTNISVWYVQINVQINRAILSICMYVCISKQSIIIYTLEKVYNSFKKILNISDMLLYILRKNAVSQCEKMHVKCIKTRSSIY